MKLRRKIIVIALAALVVAAIVHGLMPKPVAVDAVQVTRGPLRVTVEEEGKTRVMDRFVISAPVAGFARRIELEVGDPIKKGNVVAELEPLRSEVLDPRSRAEAEARIEAAGAALDAAVEEAHAAGAESDYAGAELKRLRHLSERGFVSKDELEQAGTRAKHALAKLRSAEFAVDVAGFELEKARTALRYSAAEDGIKGFLKKVKIRTPVDGRVLKVHRKSEGVVQAGEALITVGDPQAIEVEVDVLSDDAVRIGPGTRVFFDRWGGRTPLEGKVRVVEPVGFTKVSALGVEEQRVLVIADITSPPEEWERLGDGYRVEASFIIWEGPDVLRVPSSALFRYKEGWAVFVMENSRAQLRQVALGHRSGLTAEVLNKGLKAGEIVVTHPNEAIEDGTPLRLREK